MSPGDEVAHLAQYCRDTLPLGEAQLGAEYGYSSLGLCVIDAVWSIGVRYEGVTNVVRRYCAYHGHSRETCRITIPELLADMSERGVQFYADEVFRNHQRTSTRGGILKAEAVRRYAQVLSAHGINEREDAERTLPNAVVEAQLREIPGQSSGISYKYFLMLTGTYRQVKPDRMVLRFVASALGRTTTVAEAERLLMAASDLLQHDHPHLEARLLDSLIWQHQRTLPATATPVATVASAPVGQACVTEPPAAGPPETATAITGLLIEPTRPAPAHPRKRPWWRFW